MDIDGYRLLIKVLKKQNKTHPPVREPKKPPGRCYSYHRTIIPIICGRKLCSSSCMLFIRKSFAIAWLVQSLALSYVIVRIRIITLTTEISAKEIRI